MSLGASSYFPTGSVALLLKTALHSSDAAARAAWEAWERTYDIEAAS